MERIPDRIDSTFRYILLAAKRAEQMIHGAHAKVESGARKPTLVAMEEISRDVVDWDYGPAPQPEAPEAGAEATAEAATP